MNETNAEYGEVHCMLCGRHLADIRSHEDGKLQLLRPRNGAVAATVRVAAGKLTCTNCGGRAFVEWDLLPSGRATGSVRAA
jgi:hypothetical protein